LYIAATSTKGRIVIEGIITSIARFFRIDPNTNDRVRGFERLGRAAFELMGFCQIEAGRFCWIYPGVDLCFFPTLNEQLFKAETISYIYPVIKSWFVLHLLSPSSYARPSSSSQQSYPKYGNIGDTLRSM